MPDPALPTESPPAPAPKPRAPDLVFGLLAWGWVLYMGRLYFDAHGPRFRLWREATFTAGGPWRFPDATAWALAFAALVAFLAWALGRAAGARLGVWRAEPGEQAAAALAGLAALAMGVFALGVAGGLTPVGLTTLLLAAAAGTAILAPERPRWRAFVPAWRTSAALGGRPRGIGWIPAMLVGAAVLVSLLAALAPAIESDGMRYHLYAPQAYLREGRIFYIPHSAFTNFPFLVEMLFVLGMGMADDVAAKLLHWVHWPLATALIFALASRTAPERSGGAFAPWVAAALFACTPVAAIVAGWSFIDLAFTAYFLGGIWALGRWLDAPSNGDGDPSGEARRHRGDLLLAGFFFGAAVGSKYTMLVPAALATGLVVFARRTNRPDGEFAIATDASGASSGGSDSSDGFTVPVAPGDVGFFRALLRRLWPFALAGCVCSAPWFAKNLVLTGNPVYPLAYGVFGGGDWSPEAAVFYTEKAGEKGAHRGGLYDFVAAPFDTAFYWAQFEAQNPGPGYLLAFPFVVAWVAWHWRRSGGRARAPSRRDEPNAPPRDADAQRNAQRSAQRSAWRSRRRWVLLLTAFAVVTGAVFFAGYKSNRFLLPIWALLAALIGGFLAENPEEMRNDEYTKETEESPPPPPPPYGNGVARWGALGKRLLSARAALAAGLLFASLHGLHWTARYLAAEQHPPPFPAALGFVARDEYIASALGYYPAVQWLGLHAREGEKVFYIGEFRGYPSRIPLAVNDWFDVPLVLSRIRATPDNDALLDGLRTEGFRFVLVNYAELKLYAARYFRPRFADAEWERFESLLQSPRLRMRFEERKTVVYEIRESE